MEGSARGEFRFVKVLEHDKMTRGFQLSFETLCVVSNEGVGYVYGDMLGDVVLERKIEIADGAVGHLDQGEEVVVYSMGNEGYHFHEKGTGNFLGTLDPDTHGEVYHVRHPKTQFRRGPGLVNLTNHGTRGSVFPPQRPAKDRTIPLEVERGGHPDEERISLGEDEWGAGMLRGNLFVGVSRGGRLAVCSDWRKTLEAKDINGKGESLMLVECETDGSNFDLGGWLSVHDHRVMFEIQDLIYVIGLTDDDRVRETPPSPPPGHPSRTNNVSGRPSFATATAVTAQLAVPVSFMAIYDDCIMATYTVSDIYPKPSKYID